MIFFSDNNHTNAESIQALKSELKSLRKKGYQYLFVEFQKISIPDDRHQIEDDYAYCSGGGYKLDIEYSDLIENARKEGFKVLGLTFEEYYTTFRKRQKSSFEFRTEGCFDAVSAELINIESIPYRSIVFLGGGHCRLMQEHFEIEILNDPQPEEPSSFGEQYQKQAEEWRDQLIDALIRKSLNIRINQEGKIIVSVQYHGTDLKLEYNTKSFEEYLKNYWQDKYGLPLEESRADVLLDELQNRMNSVIRKR